MRRFWVWLAALFATAAVATPLALTQGGGTVDVFVGSTPTPVSTPVAATGNLWAIPDASPNGSCTRNATPETRAAAEAAGRNCNPADNSAGVLRAALVSSSTGDTVCIADGDYGRQGLASSSKTVTMKACEAGRPEFGQIVSAATNLTLQHVKVEGRDNASGQCSDPTNAVLYPCGASQTFDDVEVDGLAGNTMHGIRGPGDSFTFKNGSVHGIRDFKGFEGGPANSLIDNNRFYDIVNTIADNHEECIYWDGGDNSTISRNKFDRCPIMAVFFTQWVGGPAYSNMTFENNVVGHPETALGSFGGCGLNIGGNANRTYVGWVVRYNTFESCVDGGNSTLTSDDNASSSWYGNLGGHLACGLAEWAYSYNVGESCGATGEVSVANPINSGANPNVAPFYVDATTDDLHLKSGTNAASNAGNASLFPSIDRDGVTRATPPDAGAYERVGG